MTPRQVKELLGGTQKKAAKALGLSQPTMSRWEKLGYVPLHRQSEIQVMTAGALVAEPSSDPTNHSAKKRTVRIDSKNHNGKVPI